MDNGRGRDSGEAIQSTGQSVSVVGNRGALHIRRYADRRNQHGTKRGKKQRRDGHVLVNGRYLFTPLGHQYKW